LFEIGDGEIAMIDAYDFGHGLELSARRAMILEHRCVPDIAPSRYRRSTLRELVEMGRRRPCP